MQVVVQPEIPLSMKKVDLVKVLSEPRYSYGYVNTATETSIISKASPQLMSFY